jgi:hypothetical protein
MESYEDPKTVCEIWKDIVNNPVVDVQFKHDSLRNIIAAYKANEYTKESLECFKKCVHNLIYPGIDYATFSKIVKIQTKKVTLHSGISFFKRDRLMHCDMILNLKHFFDSHGITCTLSDTSKECGKPNKHVAEPTGVELELKPNSHYSEEYNDDALWPLRHRQTISIGGKRKSHKKSHKKRYHKTRHTKKTRDSS